MSGGDPEKAMQVVDSDDEEEAAAGDKKSASQVTAALLKNPAVMAALQGKLDGMVGTPSGYIQSLPAPVKKRLKALKKLQFEATKIEARFYEEIHELECRYHELYTPIYQKRANITKGEHEPNDDECDWPSEDEDGDDDELASGIKDKVKLENGGKEEAEAADDKSGEAAAKGVPEFWLTIFKNVDMLQEMVQEHDEPALKALQDITVTFSKNPMGFVLHFHFGANDFFSNAVLTKEYEMNCEPAEDDPFAFEGPEIFKCKGCTVNWKSGKNLTVKTVKKKQKHKSKGSVRTVTKTVKNDSFFNFFDPPKVTGDEDEDEMDEETQELLTSDFEIGHYIRERIVPRAVLFFTGEALDDDDDFEEEEEEDDDDGEEDGEEEEEEENDPDFDPSKAPKNQQECKQQ